MEAATVSIEPHQPSTGGDWEALRGYFRDTVMARTPLSSLAANLGLKWPIRGKEETPGKYIAFPLEELADWPEFYGKGNRLALLQQILLETRRLDDPFVEMTNHLAEVVRKEAEAPPLLEQLGVPVHFPVELMNFSEKTLASCREGGYETLGQLIAFLQQSASAININDEYRRFINCLNEMDANGLGQFLPIRNGARGIYLAEALGQVARRLTGPQAATLLYAYKISTTHPEWNEDAALPRAEASALLAKVKGAARKYFDRMPDQAEELREAVQSDLSAGVRFFVPLNSHDLEGLARAVAMAALDVKPRLKGFMGRFLN
ncbi:MAG: hypothetical protein ACP5I4_16250 [Oceanipulchritudo sp.]